MQHLKKYMLQTSNLEVFTPAIYKNPFAYLVMEQKLLTPKEIEELLKKIVTQEAMAIKRITGKARRNFMGKPGENIPEGIVTFYDKGEIDLIKEIHHGRFRAQDHFIAAHINTTGDEHVLHCLTIETYGVFDESFIAGYTDETFFFWTGYQIWWITENNCS